MIMRSLHEPVITMLELALKTERQQLREEIGGLARDVGSDATRIMVDAVMLLV
jgi:hypothetical protein